MEDDDDFLEENFRNIELSSDVLETLATILPSDDPLDKQNFDVIEYINQLFPTEQSLSNIDEAIVQVKGKIRKIDSDVRSIIHSQTSVGQNGKLALEEAQKAILHLFTQIQEIKVKSEKSEEMVKEITRNIKQLDIAKKNLTTSITILNHLFILVEGVESLETLVNKTQYEETAAVFQRVNNVIEHFEPFMHIEQISDLANRVKKIKVDLSSKVRREFEEGFSNPFTKLNLQHGTNLCKMLDVLDQKLRLDLLKWFIKHELNEYTVLFEENQENSWLDKIDKRYSWIKRNLAEFEEKFNKIFPSHWDMSERLAVEFCDITRRDLTSVMSKRKSEIDMKLLMFAIQRTTNFEQLLISRFVGRTIQKPSDVSDENWKPFHGIISQCFEAHFDTYISYTDNALAEIVTKFLDEIKVNSFPRIVNEESSNIHGSSADLFVFYKNCMTQCMQLFPSMHLLVRLSVLFQKYLKEYASRVLGSNLPKLATTSSFSTIGAATSLIQNFQFQTILKEAQGVSADSKKLTEAEICRACSILCTAEYCLETIQQLEDKLKEKVSKQHADKISFTNEIDVFSNLISNCIQLLVQDLENSCDPALIAMTKLPWQNFEVSGDQSAYVTAIVNHIKIIVPLIRDNLANSRKYFTQFCVKFVSNLIPKFINNIFKCKLITPVGIEQLLLDTHSLKTVLLDLPNIGSKDSRKAPASYTKIVNKGMTRAELILKCVMSPIQETSNQTELTRACLSFIDNYIKLMGDYDTNTFRMILEMKGVSKRSDLNNFIELFKTRIPTTQLPQPQQPSAINNNSNTNESQQQQQQQESETNKLKHLDKLQDLLRKKP